MSKQKIFASRWRSMMIAVSVIFACALFSLGCILFTMPAAYGTGGLPSGREDAITADDPLPRREYTSLEVKKSDGLVIYIGQTTAKDFKNNITVVGTYSTGNGNATAVLDDSEFMISQNDKLIADAAIIHNAGGDAPQFFNGEVTCGKVSANISVPYRSQVPEYNTLTVSLQGGITVDDTFNAEILKKFLTVSGTFMQGEGDAATESVEAVNKELIYISINGSFAANEKISVTAALKSNNAVISAPLEITVKAAVMKGIAVSVSSGVTLTNGIWTKADGFHAFVAGMRADTVLSSLDVFAVYENTTRPIYQNGSYTGSFNYSCVVTNGEFSSGTQTVYVEVRNNTGSSAGNASVSVAFETRRLLKIEATHDKTDAISSSEMDKRDFTVTGIYNDNTSAGVLRTDEFTVSPDTYAPSAENLKNLVDNKYTKVVRIISIADSNVFCEVTTKPITYEDIDAIYMLDGNVATQQVGKPINFDGLYANAGYADGSISRMYLSEYVGKTTADGKPYLEYELRQGTTPVATDENGLIATTQANRLWVKFNYYSSDGSVKSGTRIFNTGEILRADVEIPKLNVTPIAYSLGCSKQITGIDFGKVPFNMTLSIQSLGSSANLTVNYTTDGAPVVNGGENVGATFDALSGEITFLRGDTFTVTVTLNNENYRWVNSAGNTATLEGDDVVKYTIVINKADLNVRFDSMTHELTYGDLTDAAGNTVFSGWEDKVIYSILGSSAIIDKNTDIANGNLPDFELWYFGFDGISINNAVKVLPKKDVGTYKVLVHTIENDAYNSSTTLEGNAMTITVKAKEIAVGSAVDNGKVYSRTDWNINDFISTSDAGLVYGEHFADVATIVGKAVSGLTDGTTYRHAGRYDVTFTMKNKNYVWTGEKGKDGSGNSYIDTQFTIQKASFAFSASVANPNYQYTGTPSPSYSKNDIFYPVVNGVYEIYLASDYNSATKQPNAGAVNQLTKYDEDKLPVAEYYVHYKTTTDTANGDLATDYDLPTACAYFRVTEKQVQKVVLDKTTATYNGGNNIAILQGYDKQFMSFVDATSSSLKPVIDVANGRITAIHAATYEITVKLTDSNYIWVSGGVTSKDDYNLSFVINPCVIDVNDASGTGGKYVYQYIDSNTDHDVPSFTAGNVASGDTVTITFETYKDGVLVSGDLKRIGVGVYTIVLQLNVGGVAIGGDYVLPDNAPDKFEVASAKLVLPVWNGGNSITYDGKTHSAQEFFKNADGSALAGLVFTADKTLFNADSYIISVTPADNYSWKDGQGNGTTDGGRETVTFNFTINKKIVHFTWSGASVIFSGVEQKPIATITNLEACDAGNISILVSVGNTVSDAEANAGTGKIYVGNYFAVAYALQGAGKENYEISKSSGEYKNAFEINKQQIVLPENSKTIVFNADGTFTVQIGRGTADADKGWAWLENAGAIYPQVERSISSTLSGATFNVATGVLTYQYADTYTITLTIGNDDNYEWTNGTAAMQIVVTVNKQEVAKPSIDGNYTYDAVNKTINFTRNDSNANKGFAWLASSGKNNPDARAQITSGVDFLGGTLNDAVIALSDGTFTYVNAGVYTVRLTLNSFENYYWAGESNSWFDIKIRVERQRINIPSLDAPNVVWDNGNVIRPAYDGGSMDFPGNLIPNNAYQISYGVVNRTQTGSNRFEFNSYGAKINELQSRDRGEYFIYVAFTNGLDGTNNIYNYIFSSDNDATTGNGLVTRTFWIDDDAKGTGVYLHYAITNAILQVDFGSISYTFGDNLGSLEWSLENKLNVTDLATRKLLANEMMHKMVKITLTFTDSNGKVTDYVWEVDTADDDYVAEDISVLPWNKGKFKQNGTGIYMSNKLPKHADDYKLVVGFDYVEGTDTSAGSDYNDNSSEVSITVKKLKAELAWNYDGAAWDGYYDGNNHSYTPVITNAPKTTNADKFNLVVEITKDGIVQTNAKNAGTYIFALKEIEGTSDGIYASDFDWSESATQTLVINKVAITVKANDSTHIYGNDFANNGWTVTDGAFVGSEQTTAKFDYYYTNASGEVNGKLTPAGANYKINLRAGSGLNEFFGNYDLTYETGDYEITKRDLTVTINNNATSVYGNAVATDIYTLSEDVRTTIGDNAKLFTLSIFESEGKLLSQYSPVGSYTVTIADQNASYNITFENAVKYTVTHAQLKVAVNVSLYYGEQFDDAFKTYVDANSYAYLYEQKTNGRNTGIYSVSGFVRSEDETLWGGNDISMFGGSFGYALDGTAANGATISFNALNLTWGNYKLVANETKGTLTVERLPIIVKVKNQTVVYYDNGNIPDLMTNNVGFEIVYPASSYGKDEIVFANAPVFADIFNITSAAIVGGKTNNVGKYDITVSVKNGAAVNYGVTFTDDNGNSFVTTFTNGYEITPADFASIEDALADIGRDYNEQTWTPYDVSTKQFAVPVDKADKNTPVIVYYTYNTTGIAPSSWSGLKTDENKTMPEFIDAGKYYVYYLVTAANHKDEMQGFVATINKVSNSFTQSFNYDGKVLSANGNNFAPEMGAAWTYGLAAIDGSKIILPKTAFNRMPDGTKNNFTVKVYYRETIGTSDELFIAEQTLAYGDNVIDMLSILGDASRFNAGYYRIEIAMRGNANYADAIDSGLFRVAKAQISVTPDGYDTVYGEDFTSPVQVKTYSGFVYGQDEKSTGIANKMFVWANDYTKGEDASNDAIGYTIEISGFDSTKFEDKTYAYYHQNYELHFGQSVLVVNKREVTITIGYDYTNHFNLYNEGKTETQVVPKETIVNGSYYNGQQPIKLKTDAFDIKAENSTTNNKGAYPIYAEFVNDTFANNYLIRFSGCAYTDNQYLKDHYAKAIIDPDGNNSAGIFTISSSVLLVNPEAQFSTNVYDGTQKVYGYYFGGQDGDIGATFDVLYYNDVNNNGRYDEDVDTLRDAGAPKDVGKYIVRFVYQNKANSENYISYAPPTAFEITKASVNVQFDSANMWIEYGTAIPSKADNGYFNETYHFSGYKLTFTLTSVPVTGFETDSAKWYRSSQLTFVTNYTPSTSAGSAVSVSASGLDENNYAFTYVSGGSMQVKQRKINVYVKGIDNGNSIAYSVYSAELQQTNLSAANMGKYFDVSAFNADDNQPWYGANLLSIDELNLTLLLTNARNVGKYEMSASCGNANFDMHMTNDASSVPYFEIRKADVYVHVIGKDVTSTGDLARDWSVVFGNNIRADFQLSMSQDKNGAAGLLLGQTLEALRLAGKARGELILDDANYSPWGTDAGKCTITYKAKDGNALEFDNYAVHYVPCTFTVTARTIRIDDIATKVYDEISQGNYGDGSSGLAQHADFKFINLSAGTVNFYDGGSYKLPSLENGLITADYFDAKLGKYLGENVAPTMAGNYNIKFTLKTTNYVFEGNAPTAQKTFIIDPKPISIAWNGNSSITDFDTATDEEKTKVIGNYVNAIMNVDTFKRYFNTVDTASQEDILNHTDPNVSGGRYYMITSDGLVFKAYNTGDYRVEISIKKSASRNYVFVDNGAPTQNIILNLVVTSNGIQFISVEMASWVYGQYDPADDKYVPKVDYTGGTGGGMTYMFAKLGGYNYYDVLDSKYDGMFQTADLAGLGINDRNFTMQMSEDVGLYVFRAFYGATGQSAYCVYRISPAKIAVPTLEVVTAGENKNDVYTGSPLSINLMLNYNLISVSAQQCDIRNIEGGIRLTETVAQAKTYSISLHLLSSNYEWDTTVERDVEDKTLTWIIGKAQETLEVQDVTASYNGNKPQYDIVVNSKFNGKFNDKFNDKASFIYRVAKAGEAPSYSESDGSNWFTYIPFAVGEYWVMVSTQDADNWLSARAFGTITITKAMLTATPDAKVIYGEIFNRNGNAGYRVDFSGYVAGDNDGNARPGGTVEYDIVGADGKPISGLDLSAPLNVGTYYLKVNTAGLVSENYSINASLGLFTVSAKSITVSINSLSSVYGDAVDLSKATFNVSGDSVSANLLGIGLKLVGVSSYENLAAASYTIVDDGYTNDNYSITFIPGTYTVTKRKISINEINRGGGTVGNVAPAFVKTLLDNHTNTIIENIGAFNFVYSYTNQSGQPTSVEVTQLPVGTYYVHVAQTDGNYELVGQTAYVFEVGRLIVDGSQITIAPVQFNNSNVEPIINYGGYNANDFTVSYEGDRFNVGSATVVLTLKDTVNRRWLSTDDASYRINFTITQGQNELYAFSIQGWTYGNYDASVNSPKATAKFGDAYIFTYFVNVGGRYDELDRRPDEVGTYYVRVTVPESRNYAEFNSEYKQFEISKAVREMPTLGLITEGEGKNDVYTGSALQALINGFDSAAMEINYDGISNINGNTLTVFATNAGTYTITLILKDTKNYRWATSDDAIQLTWTVNRKKVDAPTANTSLFVVNGQDLVYLPNGFDESIMDITGNVKGYGGVHEVVVTLKDTANYEWANGTNSAYVFSWQIVGGETVFTVVASALGVLSVAAGAVALTQFLLYKKRIAAKAAAGMVQGDGEGKE